MHNLTFEDIFKEKGWYRSESFAEGVVFEVADDGTLFMVSHKSKDDMRPHREPAVVYRDLFNKLYERVYSRHRLFNIEGG
jgi:hypothetical protein